MNRVLPGQITVSSFESGDRSSENAKPYRKFSIPLNKIQQIGWPMDLKPLPAGMLALGLNGIIDLDSNGFRSALGPPHPAGLEVLFAPGPRQHRHFSRTGVAWHNEYTYRKAMCAVEPRHVRARTAGDPGIPKSVVRSLCNLPLLTPVFEPAALQTAPHSLPGPRQHDPKVVFSGNVQGVDNLFSIDASISRKANRVPRFSGNSAMQ